MTPAWVCFNHRPEEIARNAYAGLIVDGKRRLPDATRCCDGDFEVIVSGHRKGVGSLARDRGAVPRSGAASGIAIAASFAPDPRAQQHQPGHADGRPRRARAPAARRGDPARRVHAAATTRSRSSIIESGGLFPFAKALADGRDRAAAAGTGAAADDDGREDPRAPPRGRRRGAAFVKPGDAVVVHVDGGYTHEFTTAQVHDFLQRGVRRPDYRVKNPEQVRGLRGPPDLRRRACRAWRRFADKIETLRELQREFQRHTGVRDFSAKDGVSPGICHEVAREQMVEPGRLHPGDRQPHLHGRRRTTRSPGASGATEYAGAGPLRLHPRRGARVDPLRADRAAAAGRHRQGPDAPHPARTTPSRRRRSTA